VSALDLGKRDPRDTRATVSIDLSKRLLVGDRHRLVVVGRVAKGSNDGI